MDNKYLSILIIEDSESDEELIIREFQKAGYHISHKRVETADEMQAALESPSWDLIIADYNLPEFNAPSALAILQKSGLDIPFIVVSGTIGEETAVAIMKAGAHDYVMKRNLARLIPAVQRELGEAQTRQANKKAEERIKQAAEEWITTFDSITDMVSIHDADFKFVRVNKAYVHAFQMTQDELIGEHCYEIIHGTVCPISGCPHEQALKKKKPITREVYEPRLGMYLEISTSPIFSSQGIVTGSVHIVKDITERKKADEELRKSEKKYHDIFENAVEGICQSTPENRYMSVNPAMARMYGYETPAEMITAVTDISKQLYVESDKRNQYARLLHEHGIVKDFEILSCKKDGTPIWVSVSSRAMRDDEGKVLYYDATVVDVTTRKRAEDALKETLDKLRRNLLGTIQAMSMMVEVRDPYTAGHQRRVSNLARTISQEMGLTKDAVENIRMASSIHDIGKMSVPAEILSKPTELTKFEMALIKVHPQAGYDILKDVDLPFPIAEIVLQHHERLDGSGYPQGLKDSQILLGANIVAVADIVEAIASHRPYRPALGIDAALDEIDRNKGTLYDAGVAEVCLRLFREKGFRFE